MFPLNYIQPHQQPERTTKLLLYLLLLISRLLNQVDGYAKKKILEQELVFFLLLVMFQTNLTDDVVNYVTVVSYYLYQLSHNRVESIESFGLIKDIRYQKHKPYTWNMKINTSVAIVLGQTGFIISSLSFTLVNALKHSI